MFAVRLLLFLVLLYQLHGIDGATTAKGRRDTTEKSHRKHRHHSGAPKYNSWMIGVAVTFISVILCAILCVGCKLNCWNEQRPYFYKISKVEPKKKRKFKLKPDMRALETTDDEEDDDFTAADMSESAGSSPELPSKSRATLPKKKKKKFSRPKQNRNKSNDQESLPPLPPPLDNNQNNNIQLTQPTLATYHSQASQLIQTVWTNHDSASISMQTESANPNNACRSVQTSPTNHSGLNRSMQTELANQQLANRSMQTSPTNKNNLDRSIQTEAVKRREVDKSIQARSSLTSSPKNLKGLALKDDKDDKDIQRDVSPNWSLHLGSDESEEAALPEDFLTTNQNNGMTLQSVQDWSVNLEQSPTFLDATERSAICYKTTPRNKWEVRLNSTEESVEASPQKLTSMYHPQPKVKQKQAHPKFRPKKMTPEKLCSDTSFTDSSPSPQLRVDTRSSSRIWTGQNNSTDETPSRSSASPPFLVQPKLVQPKQTKNLPGIQRGVSSDESLSSAEKLNFAGSRQFIKAKRKLSQTQSGSATSSNGSIDKDRKERFWERKLPSGIEQKDKTETSTKSSGRNSTDTRFSVMEIDSEEEDDCVPQTYILNTDSEDSFD